MTLISLLQLLLKLVDPLDVLLVAFTVERDRIVQMVDAVERQSLLEFSRNLLLVQQLLFLSSGHVDGRLMQVILTAFLLLVMQLLD